MSTCMTCSTELPALARFCGTCGTPFHPLASSSEQAQTDDPRFMAAIPTNNSAAEEFMPPKQTPLLPAVPQPTTGPYAQRELKSVPPAPGRIPPPGYFSTYATHTGQVGYARATQQAATAKANKRRTSRWIILLIIIAFIALAGGGGILAYRLTHPQLQPQPAIRIFSAYTIGKTLVGSNGTTLHIQGREFPADSAVTFLLDDHTMPGAPRMVSDKNGNLNANLPITAAWPLGLHTLTVKDTSHYASKIGIQVAIVEQGQARTPGPNGAPSDDASFKIHISPQGQKNGDLFTSANTLLVTGDTDFTGGSVCKDRDNGQPQPFSSTTTSGLPDTVVYTFSCSGTYKAGQIAYTETLLSAVVTVNDQGSAYVCHLLTPGTEEQLSGSYTTSEGFTGTVAFSDFPASDFSCTTGQLPYFDFSLIGGKSTWTGTYTLNP